MPTGFAPLLGSSRSPSVPSLRAARPCSPACAAPWARLWRPPHTVTAPSSTSCSPGPGCRLPSPRAAVAAAAAAPAAAVVAMQLAPAAAVGVAAFVSVAVYSRPHTPRPALAAAATTAPSQPASDSDDLDSVATAAPLAISASPRRRAPQRTSCYTGDRAQAPGTRPSLTATCGLASAPSASPTAQVLHATPTPSGNAPYILGPRSRYPGSSATVTATDFSGRSGIIGATLRTPSPPLLAPTPTAFPAASPLPLPPLFAPSTCLTPPAALSPEPCAAPPRSPQPPPPGPTSTVPDDSSPRPPSSPLLPIPTPRPHATRLPRPLPSALHPPAVPAPPTPACYYWPPPSPPSPQSRRCCRPGPLDSADAARTASVAIRLGRGALPGAPAGGPRRPSRRGAHGRGRPPATPVRLAPHPDGSAACQVPARLGCVALLPQ